VRAIRKRESLELLVEGRGTEGRNDLLLPRVARSTSHLFLPFVLQVYVVYVFEQFCLFLLKVLQLSSVGCPKFIKHLNRVEFNLLLFLLRVFLLLFSLFRLFLLRGDWQPLFHCIFSIPLSPGSLYPFFFLVLSHMLFLPFFVPLPLFLLYLQL